MESQPRVPCSSCGHGNRADRGFCTECGTRLRRTCAACGVSAEPGEKFCGVCGTAFWQATPPRPAASPAAYTPRHLAEKILSSRSALEGERKQVTVLFADVKGSMELAEQLDPEEWHTILDRFFEILTDGVHRFEGTVNQYTGDGIMALFGAPIAHEDHAQRACWAALHLRAALQAYGDELRVARGLNFGFRLGLNSGEVVVGKIGDDLRMDYTAQGHTVGLAQRMEALADARSIVLSAHTARLVERYFTLRDLGETRIKGVTAPLHIFELQGEGVARTRLDVSRARGLSRFVGRATETRLLDTALERTVAGETQVVGVVGEAGVGKSRLCAELVECCHARGIAVYEAHCLAHGKALPFHPILQLFRAFFGIGEQDGAVEARRKIAGTLVLLDDRFRDVLPLMFEFLGVPDPERPLPRSDPDTLQRQLIALTAEVMRARSAREPALVLIDDLHWVDPASNAFIARLIPTLPATRTLFLLNFRPEYQADWMRRPDYQQIALRPLGREAVGELLDALLGTDPSLGPLKSQLGTRAGGNPFFVEELVQSLVEVGHVSGSPGAYRLERGAGDVAIPASVHGVLAARIDRLSGRAKGVLQTAAVVGREVPELLLRRIVDDPGGDLATDLAALVRGEFLVEQALYPEALYAFKHPLTQEVAYRSQLADRRARTHARVAAALEALAGGKLDEQTPLLAEHWAQAGEAAQALRWHVRAAAWLGVRNAPAAMHHLQAAHRLLPDVPESPERIATGLAVCEGIAQLVWRVGLPEDEAARVFAEGKELAARAGDPRALGRLLDPEGIALSWAGRFEEGRRLVEEALHIAQQHGERAREVGLLYRLTYLHHFLGHPQEVLEISERGLSLAAGDVTMGAEVTGFSPYLFFLGQRAWTLTALGHLSEAARIAEQGVRLATEHGERESIGFCQIARLIVLLDVGDSEAARSQAAQALETVEQIGTPFWRAWGLVALGWALVECAEWSAAVTAAEESLAILRQENRAVFVEFPTLEVAARAHLGAGDPGRARATTRELLDLCARYPDVRTPRVPAYRTAAHVLLCADGADSPEVPRLLDEAEALALEIGYRPELARIHVGRAELARRRGDAPAAQRELEEARRLWAEMGARVQVERLAKEMEGDVAPS